MILNELVQRSPIRIFEQSINGGLTAGEIGVIASQNGLGKTSVLVQLALDKLIQGKKVIHVSFTQHTHYVLAWYENIFNEFVGQKNMENLGELQNSLIKNRVLMNFNQDGISKDQILKSLRALIVDGGFGAESVIVDGFDFTRTDHGNLANVRAFANELGISVWYSCSVADQGRRYNENNFPVMLESLADLIDVAVVLEQKSDHIALTVSKDHGSGSVKKEPMKLDPRTMLILR
ncbi:MAG: hypothetical protein FWF29_03395 [Treponema sp.]|nr:hypothetical protein [Treponema sp.]